MQQFQVPQFIERDIKIVGPLSFKQFFIFLFGAAICLFLYLVLAAKSIFLLVVCVVIIGGGTLSLIFVQIRGQPLPLVISNFFAFIISGRTYLWKKKAISQKLYVIPKYKPEQPKKEEPKPMKGEGGRLGDLANQLEIGPK